jgi:hypothetical protein
LAETVEHVTRALSAMTWPVGSLALRAKAAVGRHSATAMIASGCSWGETLVRVLGSGVRVLPGPPSPRAVRRFAPLRPGEG